MRAMLRIDRHRLGPRVYVLGARVHEWHLGAALLLALAARRRARPGRADASRPRRDRRRALARREGLAGPRPRPSATRAAWRLGLHVRAAPLEPSCRADPLPQARGARRGARGRSSTSPRRSRRTSPGGTTCSCRSRRSRRCGLSHAAAVPASLLLLVTAPYLWRRRQGALRLALVLLARARPCSTCSRASTSRRPPAASARRGDALARSRLVLRPARPGHASLGAAAGPARSPLGGLLLCGARGLDRARRRARALRRSSRETFDALLWQPGPLDFHDELGAPRRGDRRRRPDDARLVRVPALPAARRAARASRTSDASPRGPQSSCAGTATTRSPTSSSAATSTTSSARTAGLPRLPGRGGRAPRLGRPGRSRSRDAGAAARAGRVRRGARPRARGPRRGRERCCPLWEQLGLRSLYLGDEAIVDTAAFSLEGRAIRKVRQSVTRLEKQGYEAELIEARRADDERRSPSSRRSAGAGGGAPRARLRDVARRASARRPRGQPRRCSAATGTGASAASSTSRRATDGRPSRSR